MDMKSNVAVTPSKDFAVARGKMFAFSLMSKNWFSAGSRVCSAIIVDSIIVNCVI